MRAEQDGAAISDRMDSAMDSVTEQRQPSTEAEAGETRASASAFIPTMPATAVSNGQTESWLSRLRRWLMPTADERANEYAERLARLDQAVARHPVAASNYILRGELHLAAGMIDHAVRDFQQGLDLANRQLVVEDWGMVTQTLRDRAVIGLEQALARQRDE